MSGHPMSMLAAVTLAWGVVYGYVAVYSVTLHGYRPGERELRPFAIATFGMMFYSLGCAASADAGTTADATRAYQVVMFGGTIAAAGFMHFACALANRPLGVEVFGSYALALISLVLNFADVLFDAGVPATPHPMLIQGRHVMLLAAPTTAYVTLAGLSLVVILRAAWIMRTPTLGNDHGERFWLSLTGAALGLAALHDALINFVPVRSVYVLEHCYVLFALAMTHHLLGRVARIDAELIRRTQQFRESLVNLERTEVELAHKEQLAAVGELSAIIAQEVRSPIASIGEVLTALHREGGDPDQRTVLLDTVDQQSDRLNHLIGDLLSYAKPLHAQISAASVPQLIERALRTIPPTIRERTVIETRIAPDPASIDCDPELLHQALRNLIDNALMPLDAGHRVTIETSTCEQRGSSGLRLSISSRRNTADSSAPHGPAHGSAGTSGTGLGLAIVDRVVRAHHGHIEIRPGEPGETTIVLTLPLHTEGADPVTRSLLHPTPSTAAFPTV